MRKVYLLKIFSLLGVLLFSSCQKQESVLIYDEINNTVETINSDYSILALDVVSISDKILKTKKFRSILEIQK